MINSNELLVKPIKVAIIDSGIDVSKCDLDSYVKISTGFTAKNGYIVEDNGLEIRNEHGTIVSMIIKSVCKNVEFVSVNILNERLATDGRILIHALEQVFTYSPDIIHLSLGTVRWRYYFPLKRIVKYAIKNNTIIVSSACNLGRRSFPSHIKGVIGVKGFESINNYEYKYKNGFFFASPYINNIECIEEIQTKNPVGNSISAAYITGHISKIKYDLGIADSKKLVEILKDRAN